MSQEQVNKRTWAEFKHDYALGIAAAIFAAAFVGVPLTYIMAAGVKEAADGMVALSTVVGAMLGYGGALIFLTTRKG